MCPLVPVSLERIGLQRILTLTRLLGLTALDPNPRDSVVSLSFSGILQIVEVAGISIKLLTHTIF